MRRSRRGRLPSWLSLSEKDVQIELDRRIPLDSKIVSGRIEKDAATILAGVFNGLTTGAPISIVVENKEAQPSNYEVVKDLPRPAHADYTAGVKYGRFNDYRGGALFRQGYSCTDYGWRHCKETVTARLMSMF